MVEPVSTGLICQKLTLPDIPVKTVITKFGSVPDFTPHLDSCPLVSQATDTAFRHSEFLARQSFLYDRCYQSLSGIMAIRSEVSGRKDGRPAIIAQLWCMGILGDRRGTGSIAQLLLNTGKLKKPGVWPAVEQALPTNLFEQS